MGNSSKTVFGRSAGEQIFALCRRCSIEKALLHCCKRAKKHRARHRFFHPDFACRRPNVCKRAVSAAKAGPPRAARLKRFRLRPVYRRLWIYTKSAAQMRRSRAYRHGGRRRAAHRPDHRRWGITPRPETDFLPFIIIQHRRKCKRKNAAKAFQNSLYYSDKNYNLEYP